MRLAIALLLLIALSAGISTLIPQGNPSEYYMDNYPMMGYLLVKSGFTNFFRSAPFIILLAMFFVNLSLCAVKRVYKEITKSIPKSVGPDLIHISLLLIMIGGFVNILSEEEVDITLSEGESIIVNEYTIHLDKFEFLEYADSTPRDWVSHITITDSNNNVIARSVPVEVNHPLRFKGLSIFQNSYKSINFTDLKSTDGSLFTLKTGFMLDENNKKYIIERVNPGVSAFFRVVNKDGSNEYYEFKIGSVIGAHKLINTSRVLSSGIYIKKEPGFLTILVALIILLIGFVVTYIQKIGVKKL